ncbi:uncharacterized protein LOC143012331 isoform X2 [Genypterus blacodes]|uniref:uncharacterized protein LOC143012331 isoform X2 n=1 Tax=Genypterus blacodes TaxID=154954 RepID=UPI003F7746D9
MSRLLEQIRCIDENAARKMEEAGLVTDSVIRSLTGQQLLDFFPGQQHAPLRVQISQLIEGEYTSLLQEMRGFIPNHNFQDALSSTGVLRQYLNILKGLKYQVTSIQMFLDAQIALLEDYSQTAQQRPGNGASAAMTDPPSSSRAVTDHRPPGTQGPSAAMTDPPSSSRAVTDHRPPGMQVLLHMVISGKTFNTHQTIMDKVCQQDWFSVRQTDIQTCQVVIVFCPISSRLLSDVEAAMSQIPASGEKPVILVMMHHTREPRTTSPVTTLPDRNLVLAVSVFFHETSGLLKCRENYQGVYKIKQELLKLTDPSDAVISSAHWESP